MKVNRNESTIRVNSTRSDQQDVVPYQGTLYPGDSIEYGITHEVRLPDGTSLWMKMSSTTKVQPGEAGGEAANRLAEFIHAQTEQKVVEAVYSAQRIN